MVKLVIINLNFKSSLVLAVKLHQPYATEQSHAIIEIKRVLPYTAYKVAVKHERRTEEVRRERHDNPAEGYSLYRLFSLYLNDCRDVTQCELERSDVAEHYAYDMEEKSKVTHTPTVY